MKKTWKQETKNKLGLLSLEYFVSGLKKGYLKRMGFDYKYYKKIKDEGFKLIEHDLEFQNKVKENIKKDIHYIGKIIEKQYLDCDNLLKVCKELWNKDFSKYSANELKQTMKKVAEAYFFASYTILNQIPFAPVLEEQLINKLKSKISDQAKIKESVTILTLPYKETETSKAHKELYRMAFDDGSIKEWLKKYEWLNVQFGFGEPFTEEEIRERIESFKNKNPEKRYLELTKISETNEKQTKEIIENLNLDHETQIFINQAKENAFFRTYRLEVFSKAGYYILGFHKEIAKRLGVTFEELFHMSINEILKDLEIREEIQKRIQCLGYLYEDGKVTIYTEDNIHEIEETRTADQSKLVFKGTPSHKGIVEGTVKIVMGKEDLDKIASGNIMVAKFTTPHFIPAMERAGAIVTDLGGITSHTAVVGRELGKPCIVGLEDASLVLKDGDKVIVNADEGYVRKDLGLKKLSTGDYKVSLIMYLFVNAFVNQQKKTLGYGHNNMIVVFNDSRTKFFMDPKEIEEVGDLAISYVEKDINFGSKIIKDHVIAGKELIQTCEEIYNSDLKSLSNNQLLKLLRRYFLKFTVFSGYHLYPVSLEKQIAKKMQKVFDNDTLMTLATPSEETNLVKEKKDLLKIAIIMQDSGIDFENKYAEQLINNHRSKYEWMGVTHKYTPHDFDHYLKRLKEFMMKNPKQELEKMIRAPKENQAKRARLMEQVPEEFKPYADLLMNFTYMRDFKRDTGYKSHYYMEKMWEEIGKRAELNTEQVKNCIPEEVENFLEHGKKIDSYAIDDRMKYHILAVINGEMKLFTGNEAKELEQNHAKEEEVKETTCFKGMAAFKGKAKGEAKVILKPEDIYKINQGDIMVAVNTEPAMVPGMEKAAAIITDEGGLTCHATIVSRELKKPCVIGTKIATQMIKDGDLVEVENDKINIRGE